MTDTCGHETADGTPCENPATEGDHCWLDAHGGDADVGRPTKYDEQKAAEAISAAREGLSKAGCARVAGVGKATLERWLDAEYEYDGEIFRNAFARARGKGEKTLVRNGLNDPDVDSSMAKFLLSTSFDYVKTEKQEVEHSGEGGGALEVTINESVRDDN